MDQNTTPTSRRNKNTRSRDSGTPQEDPNVGFVQFSQQTPYIPRFENPNFGFQNAPISTQIPYNFTYDGLIAQGFQPANFTLPPPANFHRPQPTACNYQEEEFVPETQQPETPQSLPTQESNPSGANRSSKQQKGKQKKSFDNRLPRQRWTKPEEIALVRAWVEISEDSIVGNSQSGDSFWKRIEKMFYNIMGEQGYRSHHQLNAKFNDINKKVTRFAGIYNNLVSNRSSGTNDADILQTALNRYRDQIGKSFDNDECWRMLKQSPRWLEVPPMASDSSRPSKRSKTSESSDAHVNLVDEDEVEPAQLQRPIGRGKAKKASGSRSIGTDEDVQHLLLSQINLFNERSDSRMEYKMKKIALEERQLELQLAERFDSDLEFYLSSTEHLTGRELAVALAKKEKIKKLHNFQF